MKRIMLVSVLAVLPMAAGAPASRADSASLRTIVDRFAQLDGQGATRATVESVLQHEFGLRIVRGVPVANKLGSPGPSDVVLDTPIVTSREAANSPYIMLARMHWNRCAGKGCWEKDRGGNGAGDHGGPDGLAIQISRSINRTSSYMIRTTSCGDQLPPDPPSTDNEHGVGFKVQDDQAGGSCRNGWNWDKAFIGDEFRFTDGHGYCTGGNPPYNVQTKFTHTWDTTSLTGISISENGIGFNWNDTAHEYEVIPSDPWTSDC
ncbi:MAG TPA: hypothetical protein VEN99_13990 [Acidimicrobiia bacterium]|nr:hypothetical protein [Acidimicrobiia bacterium]